MKISPYSQIIIDEAKKHGITVSRIGQSTKSFMLSRKNKHTFIFQSLTELTNNPSYKIAANKFLTNVVMRRAGFPMPMIKLIKNEKDAEVFLKQHKKIVIKPLSANQGKGITIGIKDQDELAEAIKLAHKHTKKNKLEAAYRNVVLAEKSVPGDDHRVLVIDYKYVFAIKKIPAYILGDGQHTIKQLIELKNKKKLKHKKLITIDNSLRHVLVRQGLKLRDVPEEKQQVFVRRTANLATGGETIDITDTLNSRIKKKAMEAARTLKMPVAGFDFMCRDYTKSHGYFIEVNPIPGLMMHHYPHHGKARNPSKKVIELLIKRRII